MYNQNKIKAHKLVNYHSLQQNIGIAFGDTSLLQQAFYHSSFVNENPDLSIPNNERLEFLGDAVLNFIVAEKMYLEFPNMTEGELTVYRTSLIREDTLAQLALEQIFINPFASIAAGIALVALGSLIQSATTRQNRFAVGTRNAPGGMALVGERGPEMISLPRGSQVLPAAQTSNMLGGMPAAVEIYGILRGQDIYFSNKKYSATYARTT